MQNGSACVPGPLSLDPAPFTTTYSVDGSVAAAARTPGTAASPMTNNDAEIPAAPGKMRIPVTPMKIC